MRHAHRRDADRRRRRSSSPASPAFPVQPNKAIVGANAFAHESGHPPGRRAEAPRDLRDHARRGRGLERQQARARQALRPQRVQDAPAASSASSSAAEEALNAAFARFKELADKKREIFDEDLQALVSDETVTPEHEHFRLVSLKVVRKPARRRSARVAMAAGDAELHAEAQRQRPGGRGLQGDRADGASERGAAAVLGQQHHDAAPTRRAR